MWGGWQSFLVVFQGYRTITCAANFYSIKYISSFCVLYAFFVYNILDSFRCSFIFCSYCIVQEVIVLKVLFDDFYVFKSLLNFLWKLLFTLRNLIWCTILIMTSSNVIRFFNFGEHLLLFILYLETFSFCITAPRFIS